MSHTETYFLAVLDELLGVNGDTVENDKNDDGLLWCA